MEGNKYLWSKFLLKSEEKIYRLFDNSEDTVEQLKKYAIENNVDDSKWNLVTGDKEEIYRVARDGYFADNSFKAQESVSNFIHTENFYLIDKNGKIRGVYNGTLEVEVERLKRHIITLEKENI